MADPAGILFFGIGLYKTNPQELKMFLRVLFNIQNRLELKVYKRATGILAQHDQQQHGSPYGP